MNTSIRKGDEMYFDPRLARLFAEREENYKHEQVAEIVAKVMLKELENSKNPLHLADLGAGAHPDRYQALFDRLLEEPKGKIDWVDYSPIMLDLAKEYLDKKGLTEREAVIDFICLDSIEYLNNQPAGSLHGIIMKYTLEDYASLEELFTAIRRALKPTGGFVATIGKDSPELKSYSSNARYLYHGSEFPLDETRTLDDGEAYGIKFYTETGNPEAGYLEGTETLKYFHSPETIKSLANKTGFTDFYGNWKELFGGNIEGLDQNVLVLKKS